MWRNRMWVPCLQSLRFEGTPRRGRDQVPLLIEVGGLIRNRFLRPADRQTQLFEHLERDIPEVFNTIQEWQRKTLSLVQDVEVLQWEWAKRIDKRWGQVARQQGRSWDAPYVWFSRRYGVPSSKIISWEYREWVQGMEGNTSLGSQSMPFTKLAPRCFPTMDGKSPMVMSDG